MLAEGVPDTPAGHQLDWWLKGIGDQESMTAEEVIRRHTKMWPNADWLKGDAEGRRSWKGAWDRFGPFTVDSITSASDFEISVVLAPKEGRPQKVTFLVEESKPHRIRLERWDRVYDFDLVVREATGGDAAVLTDIERRSPVTVGDTKIVTDRGTTTSRPPG